MDRFDLQGLYEKCGGVFRFTVLVQKRLKQLNSGARPLVKRENRNLKELVYKEILEGKIALVNNTVDIREVEEQKITDKVKDLFSISSSDIKLPSLK